MLSHTSKLAPARLVESKTRATPIQSSNDTKNAAASPVFRVTLISTTETAYTPLSTALLRWTALLFLRSSLQPYYTFGDDVQCHWQSRKKGANIHCRVHLGMKEP